MSSNMKIKVQQKKITKISKLNKIEENFIFDLCQWYSGKKQKIIMPDKIRDEVLFAHLSNNGCAGIFFKFLEDTEYQIPDKWLGYCRDEYFAVMAINTVFKQTAEKVDMICRKANLNYIIIKGIALIESIYREKGLRSLTDIDLIVESREKALLLVELLKSETHLGPTVYGIKFKDHHHLRCSIYNEQYEQPIEVDIHYPIKESIAHSYKLFDSISERLFKHKLRMKGINFPDPSAHFLILLFHLVHHHLGARLIWYLDIACLLNQYPEQMDWDMILHECEKLEFKNILFYILKTLRTKFGINVPATIMKKAAEVPGLNNGILKEMVSPKNIIMDSFGGGEIFQHPAVSIKRLTPVFLYTLFPLLFNDKKKNVTTAKERNR